MTRSHRAVPRHPELAEHLHDRYGPRELEPLAAWLEAHQTLTIESLDNGLYRALGTTTAAGAVSGYHATWLRDTVHVAECLRQAGGSTAQAVRTARTLLRWFEHERPRFEACIRGTADLSDPMQRPHIRFRGDTLSAIDQTWSHAQNDALGITLWYCARLVREGAFTPTSEELNALVRCAHYFAAIHYERDADSGHWEELPKVQASSVGAVIAGLSALSSLARDLSVLRGELRGLGASIERGRGTLMRLLPAESRGEKDPRANRLVDSALLFLIEPLNVVDDGMAERILTNVQRELAGPHGIRRYRGDSYWMADYPARMAEAERTATGSEVLDRRDALLVPGGEAQWCLFDPVVAIAYGRLARRTGDGRHRVEQLRHVVRSLCQITGPDAPVGEGRCPEAYYRTALDERAPWEANDNTPLAWTQAMLLLALHELTR